MEKNTTQISILAKIEKIREVVSDYLSKNKDYTGLNGITELQANGKSHYRYRYFYIMH
jgi:hypothetical protein